MSGKNYNIGILGGSGIGQIHARIFNEQGIRVSAILGASEASAQSTAGKLKKDFGIDALPFHDFTTLIHEVELDACSLCTPAELHLTMLEALIAEKIPIFCEKPVFWHKNLVHEALLSTIARLKKTAETPIVVNTCNVALIEQALSHMDSMDKIHSFDFQFYTRGRHKGIDIAVDLLPHALSCLVRVKGIETIAHLQSTIKENNYECTFNYGDCKVRFEFQECITGPKSLVFALNNRVFRRVQEGFGNSYRVFVKECSSKLLIPAQDPFITYIMRFIHYLKTGDMAWKRDWETDLHVMNLMGHILLAR